MTTATYMAVGFVLAIALNRLDLLSAANAIHVIMGLYAGVIATAALERRWEWVLYYAAAIQISVAVLWMGRHKP